MDNERNRESGDGLTTHQWIMKHLGGHQLTVRQLLVQTCKPESFRYIMSVLDEGVGMAGFSAGTPMAIAQTAAVLLGVYLSARASYFIFLFLRGKMDGKHCAKSIIDEAVVVGSGFIGGLALGSIGALFGPIGGITFGVFGSLIGTFGASIIIDQLTRKLFDLAPTQALEESYKYLGLHHKATNGELNKAFHKLCLKHHPDKGGNIGEFLKLQSMFQIVKFARGQVTMGLSTGVFPTGGNNCLTFLRQS